MGFQFGIGCQDAVSVFGELEAGNISIPFHPYPKNYSSYGWRQIGELEDILHSAVDVPHVLQQLQLCHTVCTEYAGMGQKKP